MAEPLPSTQNPDAHIKKVSYTHDAMVDRILREPTISGKDLALYFNRSEAWISAIINSDAFQARLAQRKTELVDPVILVEIESRFQTLAHQSLDIIQKKLAGGQNTDLAMKSLELSTKALGFGARDRSQAPNVTFVVALPEKAADQSQWAEQARKSAATAAGLPKGFVDVEAKEVQNG